MQYAVQCDDLTGLAAAGCEEQASARRRAFVEACNKLCTAAAWLLFQWYFSLALFVPASELCCILTHALAGLRVVKGGRR